MGWGNAPNFENCNLQVVSTFYPLPIFPAIWIPPGKGKGKGKGKDVEMDVTESSVESKILDTDDIAKIKFQRAAKKGDIPENLRKDLLVDEKYGIDEAAPGDFKILSLQIGSMGLFLWLRRWAKSWPGRWCAFYFNSTEKMEKRKCKSILRWLNIFHTSQNNRCDGDGGYGVHDRTL